MHIPEFCNGKERLVYEMKFGHWAQVWCVLQLSTGEVIDVRNTQVEPVKLTRAELAKARATGKDEREMPAHCEFKLRRRL